MRGDKSILPGNVTQEMSFAANQLIKQGAKLATNAEEVIEEPPTPLRAVLVQAEAVESGQRNLLAADGLNPIGKKVYELLSAEQAGPIDDLVETTGLNSSEVLATLLDLKRHHPATVGGAVHQGPFVRGESSPPRTPHASESTRCASEIER